MKCTATAKDSYRPVIIRAQHGLSPTGNLINMHKISKIVSVGFSSQLLADT